jgi:hypothetical protein
MIKLTPCSLKSAIGTFSKKGSKFPPGGTVVSSLISSSVTFWAGYKTSRKFNLGVSPRMRLPCNGM